MAKIENEPNLLAKRKELMWSLASQNFNKAQIGRIFGLGRSRSQVIMSQMPKNYQSPWSKIK
jgi:hypothetical protein